MPRVWGHQPCFILGGGPGLKDVDISALRHRGRVLAINNAYQLDPWADCLYFNDPGWIDAPNNHRRKVRETFRGGLIVTQCSAPPGDLPIRRLLPTTRVPLSRNPDLLAGLDSGTRALNLAFLLGADPIMLLGFDMRPGSWHAGHAEKPTVESYARFTAAWKAMVPAVINASVRVWNCTLGSDLTCVPERDILEVLAELPRFVR